MGAGVSTLVNCAALVANGIVNTAIGGRFEWVGGWVGGWVEIERGRLYSGESCGFGGSPNPQLTAAHSNRLFLLYLSSQYRRQYSQSGRLADHGEHLFLRRECHCGLLRTR